MKKLSIMLLMLLVAFLLPCMAAAETEPLTVYLDATNGADTNTGLTEAQAVQTIEKAYGVLADQITDSTTVGKIVLVTDYTHTMTAQNQYIVSSNHSYEVIITGKTLTVHYSGTAYLGLRGPTTFENITMNVSGSSNMTIYGDNGGLLKIGENVKTTSATKFKLSAGPMKSGYSGPMSIEVNSGSWQDLFAGCYMYTLTGSGSLTMNGGSAVNVQTTYNGKHTGDLTITLNGGTVTNLYGGTISTKLDPDGVGTFVNGGATLNLGGGNLTIGTGIRLAVTGTATGTTVVTVSGAVYLDLNGKTLTGDVSGEGTLYGMDSATDKYTTDTMGRIEGTVSCNVEAQFRTSITGNVRRYMAIKDDSGYTFHRFWMGITHMNLKPGANGVGYKAAFYGDEQVLQQVTGYGYTLWVGENGKKLSAGKEGAFISGQTVTARLQNFDVENYGETPVYGQVYLTLEGGTTIESTVCSYTFRSLVEQVAANSGSYTESQLSALRDMLLRFESTVSGWNIDAIL